jgi:predicted dehydrogenase
VIGIAVLGAGDVAERHVKGLVAAGGVRLVSITDVVRARAEALASRYGFERVAPSAEAAFAARDVDLVVVLTPHDLHAPQATAALSAGKDVLCEKPMARTLAECDAMLAAARASGRRLFVTHSYRADFFYAQARARVDAGALGKLTLGAFRWFTDEIARLEDPAHWKGTRERSGGGVLIDGGCHVADLGNAYFGRARRVQALAGRLVARREGLGEDTAAFAVEYASGALATFTLSFVAGSAFRGRRFAAAVAVDLYGTQGHIESGLSVRDDDFRRYVREHRSGEPDRAFVPDGRGTLGDIDTALLRAMRGEAPAPVTALDARNAVAVVEAAYRSLASGRTEEVDWREAET